MKILFSPIGNTDPWRNDRDGAMLHIVRHYQPDRVVLFFTESIWQGNQHFSGQQAFDWVKIIQSINENCQIEIKCDTIEVENDFDAYKDLFHQYLVEEKRKYPNAEIFLNVTSGTPQMETTLCLEYVTYPDKMRCIQVSTPLKTSNAKTKYAQADCQEVDLEIVNEEESQQPSRCHKIAILSFREAIVRNQIKSLLDNYDYEAALQLVASQKSFRNGKEIRKKLKELIDDIKMHRVFSYLIKQYPRNEKLQKALLHTILLEMRHQRGDIAETLIRVKSIAEYIVEQYIQKNYPYLIIYKEDKPYFNVSYSQELTESYLALMNSRNKKTNKKMTVDSLDRILGFPAYRDFLQLLEASNEMTNEMNKVNEINNLRNKVAHNLDSLNLDRDKNGRKITNAVTAVRTMLLAVFPEVQENDFHYLKQFNQSIKELL